MGVEVFRVGLAETEAVLHGLVEHLLLFLPLIVIE